MFARLFEFVSVTFKYYVEKNVLYSLFTCFLNQQTIYDVYWHEHIGFFCVLTLNVLIYLLHQKRLSISLKPFALSLITAHAQRIVEHVLWTLPLTKSLDKNI
jgi:hypothetical protein